jgi:hypothetical protein
MAQTSMGTTRNNGSESDANIDWLREIHQPTSTEIFNERYERAVNHFKPLPLPFSYYAEVERLKRELALAESAKIESELRIRILKDEILGDVHQARQFKQLQQQRQHEQHGRSLLEQWQWQHQQHERPHDHRIYHGGESYHDHHPHRNYSSLQQQHTNTSGRHASHQRDRSDRESILPPKKRVRCNVPDEDNIKSAAACNSVGELVDYPASSFSSVVSSSTPSTMVMSSWLLPAAACNLPVQLDTPLISSMATNFLRHRGQYRWHRRGIAW